MEDDSDDDDDSYFNHLQEAANRLDDEGNENEDNSQTKQSSKNQKEFKNDNEYYDQIQQECGQESNIISSGNNMVWQSLLRNVTKVDIDSAKYNNNRQAFQCIDLVYDKDNPRILLVEQWLLSQLPISSYALSRIRSRYLFPVDNLTLWVDDFLHPSTLILAKFEKSINKDFSGVSYAFSSHLFSALPSVNDLKPLLVSFLPVLLSSSIGNTPLTEVAQQQQVDQPFEPSSIEWESIEDRITYVMQDILNNTSLSRSQIPRKPLDVYTYVVYVYQGPMEVLRADPNAVSIKTGYQLRKLTQDDVAIVNDNWKYRFPGSLEFISRMIASTPCVGVYECTTGCLVSWALTYEYGAIGMMFTLEAHRRKGLARSLLNYILPLWYRATDWGCAPYCHIDPTNDSSRAMFTSLGFVKSSDQTWITNK